MIDETKGTGETKGTTGAKAPPPPQAGTPPTTATPGARWDLRSSRPYSPLLDRSRLKEVRHNLYQAGFEFSLVTEADSAEQRSAQGTVNQQASEEQVQAFLEVYDQYGHLLPSVPFPQPELQERWATCRDLRNLQASLLELAQRVNWTATLREQEIAKITRDGTASLETQKQQNEGTANTEPAEALDMMERIRKKLMQGRDQQKKDNEKLIQQGDQHGQQRDAYVAQLEGMVETLKQQLADSMARQTTQKLPYPTDPTGAAGPSGKKPGKPNPPNSRRNRRPGQ